ncbi:MAG: hypothetical protein HYZ14_16145 [Bacteroidetes bacterium]|nr:hypothetical protein [Bacteroidota bacterium]
MKIPIVGENKYVILRADVNTGHLLNLDGTLYLQTGNNYFEVIEGEKQAKEYAQSLVVKLENIEVVIYDGHGNYVTTCLKAKSK